MDDDNLDWYLAEIGMARSRERLDWIAEMVKYCQWEDEPWTKDEDGMVRLRSKWNSRLEELTCSKN